MIDLSTVLRRRIPIALALFAALGISLTSVPARGAGTCVTPPEIMPVADLTPGMMGTGLTAVSGDTPEPFDVEILGVLDDGIGPGIDMILVQVSGPLIDETEGIAAGMSGSPVTIGGKLVGSVSYGFFAADQTIGGVTPAEAMMPLFDSPATPSASANLSPSVELTPKLRRTVAQTLGVPSSTLPSGLQKLRVPVVVSGLGERAMAALNSTADKRGLMFYNGGSAQAPQPADPDPLPLEPGQPLAAVASYGDVTFAGVGTATAVCGNLVLGWGHRFVWIGQSQMGLTGAEIITVVSDPSHLFGPFKLANLTETHGIVDQDRRAAIRGVEGEMPSLVPVTSHFENADLGTSRDGQTDIALQDGPWGFWDAGQFFWGSKLSTSLFAGAHAMVNIDAVFDEWWDGSAHVEWTINGTRKNGSPFTLHYDNMYYDASWLSALVSYRLSRHVSLIEDNRRDMPAFAGINVTDVDIEGEVTQERNTSRIAGVLSSSPLQPAPARRSLIRARPGQEIDLQVRLNDFEGGQDTIDLTVKVPKNASGTGPLVVTGGCLHPSWWDPLWDWYCYSQPYGGANLAELLQSIRNETKNNEVQALLFPSRFDFYYGTGTPDAVAADDGVVTGRAALKVKVVG
ncbi:MAG: SpoIVB peptidase S55 domain-containing protein [Actinomycetota bacterium]